MEKNFKIPVKIAAVVIVFLIGGAGIALLKETERNIILINKETPKINEAPFLIGGRFLLPFLQAEKEIMIADKEDFIEANLPEMKVILYKGGELKKEYPVSVKGKIDSWGQTPGGKFKILQKEADHFSSLGRVYQPWNIRFWGNYSIHGWPYYPDGELTQRSFSSGCINIDTEDSKELYGAVSEGLPVLVFGENFATDGFSWTIASNNDKSSSEISAQAYLAADLKNNQIFFEKNSDQALSIGSISKFMAALVSTEYFYLSYQKERSTNITIDRASLEYRNLPMN